MSAPFMQLYVADYLGDTRHLTTEQHGAYLLLLMTMWRSDGRLPNDCKKLARIAGCTPSRWAKISAEVMAFFEIDGADIINERLMFELEKASEKSIKRSDAGIKGAEAKSLKNNRPAQAIADGLPKHSSEPESEPEETDADDTGADAWPNAQIVETLIAAVGSPRLDHTKSHGLVLSSGRLMAWKAAGAKWRRDVVPTITACCARSTGPIRSWSYFDGAIADAIANNTRALEIPEAKSHERHHADPKTAKRTANDANNARAFAAARALAQQRAE